MVEKNESDSYRGYSNCRPGSHLLYGGHLDRTMPAFGEQSCAHFSDVGGLARHCQHRAHDSWLQQFAVHPARLFGIYRPAGDVGRRLSAVEAENFQRSEKSRIKTIASLFQICLSLVGRCIRDWEYDHFGKIEIGIVENEPTIFEKGC